MLEKVLPWRVAKVGDILSFRVPFDKESAEAKNVVIFSSDFLNYNKYCC
jgi:hypothetical protein